MVVWYAPLVLPQNVGAMPIDYQSKIPFFDSTQNVIAQQNVDKINYFFKVHEVEIENVTMRLFVQIFGGQVWKWFKVLPTASITTSPVLHRVFLDRWEVKKNPLQILFKYENIKRNTNESVQDYCVRFNVVYNAILANIKPLEGLALLKFPDSFHANMAYQLRECDPTTLEYMQKNVVNVEENLQAKRARMRSKKRVTIKEEESTSDVKMDTLIRTVEKLVDRITITDRPEPPIKNPNFRGQQQPKFWIKQREQKAPDQPAQQQHIKTPLQQFYVQWMEEEDEGDTIIEVNHFFTTNGMPISLTEDEEYTEVLDIQRDEDYILGKYIVLEVESDDY